MLVGDVIHRGRERAGGERERYSFLLLLLLLNLCALEAQMTYSTSDNAALAAHSKSNKVACK